MRQHIHKNIPKVGDNRLEVTSTYRQLDYNPIPERCVVEYINDKHGYYTVKFLDTGVRESYKFIKYDPVSDFRVEYIRTHHKKPIGWYVAERKIFCNTLSEVAVALDIPLGIMKSNLKNDISVINGFHIYRFY